MRYTEHHILTNQLIFCYRLLTIWHVCVLFPENKVGLTAHFW